MACQPNVLLIVADDMGYGDFGRFGDGGPRTPTLDRLIDEGLCLTQHYSGSPVCSPARAALLTGRYPHRTGAITPQEVIGLDRIHPREVTLGDCFQHAGYRTGLIGKWHNGALDDRFHPNRRGFDEFVGFRGGWMDYWSWWIERGTRGHQSARQTSDGRYLTDVFTEEALAFVRRHRANLCSHSATTPHTPRCRRRMR
jgi:arylsulfatase A